MKLRAGVTDKTEDKNVQVNDTINDTVNVQVNDTIKISQLTERQRKIYEAIKNVPINVPINVFSLATMFNVSEKTIKRDLYVLRDLNLIKYIGSNKTGHWEVIN